MIKMRKNIYSRTILYLFVVIVAFSILFPYIVMFLSSLKNLNEIFAIPSNILPDVWRWSNYIDIWTKIPLATFFKNSAIMAFGATTLCIVCAIPAGYALARMRFPGKHFLMSAIIVTQMFSAVVLLVGIYRLMVSLRLQNTRTGIILLVAAFNQAFAAWLLSGTFRSIPKEIEDAAWIDGCSRFSSLVRVILPMAAPGIVTAVIFVFINAWNEYTLTLVLIGDTSLKSFTVGLQTFFGYTNIEWWYVFAAALLGTAPILFLFQFLEKHLVSGLTAGAVKG